MSFAKPETKREDNFDAEQRLMCSAPGCNKRWTVHMEGEKPKCSKHQWEKQDYKAPDLKEVFKNSSPVKHWQDDRDEF